MNKTDIIQDQLKGSIRLVTKDKDGNVIAEHTQCNMIVKGIRPIIVSLLAGSGYGAILPSISKITFGDGSTAPTVNDVDLSGTTVITKTILTAASLSDSNRKATFSVLLGDTESVGSTIREAGLFSGSTLIARTTFGSYTKSAGTYFEFYWTIGYDA